MSNENSNEMIFELADKLKSLRERKKALEDETKANNEAIEKIDAALSKAMTLAELQSFNRSNTLFYLSPKIYASAKAEQKPELFKALRCKGFGSLITETVNANSLSAFVREQMGNNDGELPAWLEGNVNVLDRLTVALRKAK